jgi:hypothetical protein
MVRINAEMGLAEIVLGAKPGKLYYHKGRGCTAV